MLKLMIPIVLILLTACQQNPKPKNEELIVPVSVKETIKYKTPIVTQVGKSKYSVTVDSFFKLGDADSIITARKIALESAKQESSSIIGAYVESELQATNGILTVDEIKVYTASVMSSKINNEERLFKDGSSTLKLNVTSIIDENVLNQKMNELKNRTQSKEEILRLGKKNDDLLDRVQKLSNEIRSKDKKDYSILVKKREKLLTQINENNTRIGVVFKKGILFEMYNLGHSDFEMQKLSLLDKFKTKILNDTIIETEILEMKNNKDGQTVNIKISLKWVLPEKAFTVLDSYFMGLNNYSINRYSTYNPENERGYIFTSENLKSLVKEYSDKYKNRELYIFNYPWFNKSTNSDRLFETAFNEDLSLSVCLENHCNEVKVMYYTDRIKDVFGKQTKKTNYSDRYHVYKNSYIMEKDNKPNIFSLTTEEVIVSKYRTIEINNIPISKLKDISKIKVNLRFVKNRVPKFQDIAVVKD